jgi:hypothetical protein
MAWWKWKTFCLHYVISRHPSMERCDWRNCLSDLKLITANQHANYRCSLYDVLLWNTSLQTDVEGCFVHVFEALSRSQVKPAESYCVLDLKKELIKTIFCSTVVRHFRSRGSSGSIVSDYGLDDRGSIPGRGRGFCPCVHTGSEAHPASCPMGTGGPFPGGKARPGSDADHSPPSSAEVKNE